MKMNQIDLNNFWFIEADLSIILKQINNDFSKLSSLDYKNSLINKLQTHFYPIIKKNELKIECKIKDKHVLNHYNSINQINEIINSSKDVNPFWIVEGASTFDVSRILIKSKYPRHMLDPGTGGTMGCAMGYGLAGK